MVGFSTFRVGPCQDGHLAAARRDTLQSRRPVGRGEHDRVVVQPRRAAQRRIDSGNGDRRAPGQRHSHQHVAVRVRRPIDCRAMTSESSDVAAADERPRFELVERPHQKLRLVVADVQDACAVRRDRDRVCRSRAAGEHDRRANDAWWLRVASPTMSSLQRRAAATRLTAAGTARRRTSPRLRLRCR